MTELRTDVAHAARIYDYLLGGKDNFAADRAAADHLLATVPDVVDVVRQNRAFLGRVTRFLAGEAGIRQFLDIGTGIPTSPNLHEIAQGIAPESRVVYVDNDKIVLAHARALLESHPKGRTAYIDADIREPQAILTASELLDTLDLTQPVALSILAVAHFLPDETDPWAIVRHLVDPLPRGSFLALTHFGFGPSVTDEQAKEAVAIYRRQGMDAVPRIRSEVLRFFDGLDLVDPGLVHLPDWRPDADTAVVDQSARQVVGYAGVASKP